MELTALGLPLAWNEPDPSEYTVSPISALVVMKGIDSNGYECHTMMTTVGMNNVEAMGLLKFAELSLDTQMRREIIAQADESQEE